MPNYYRVTTPIRELLKVVCMIVVGFSFGDCSAPTPPISDRNDTTSHAFTWSLIHLGDGASSSLYDVAIVNDTLAYAVGEIYLRDSLGNWDPECFNVARWSNGTWTLLRATGNFRGSIVTPPVYGICALSPSDIWLAAGGAVLKGNSSTWELHDVRTTVGDDGLNLESVWGTPGGKIYFVGRNGGMATFDRDAAPASQWQRLQSPTRFDYQDIWGGVAGSSQQPDVIAVASDRATALGKQIVRIDAFGVQALGDSGLPWSLASVWFVPKSNRYVVGDGIYWSGSSNPDGWTKLPDEVTPFYSTRVRGNGTNDVMIAGSFGELLHYNGSSWWSYRAVTALSDGAFSGLSVRGDLVIAVGDEGARAVAAIGRR